jgi:hypothetical protein
MVTSNIPAKRGRPAKAASVAPEASDTILIHFVDNFTALGTSWEAGQELEIVRGSAEFQRTCDRHGNSWLDTSEETQLKEGGKVRFKKGPSDIPNPIINYTQHLNEKIDFYGVSNAAGSYLSLAAKKAAAEKEIARGRGVPAREW